MNSRNILVKIEFKCIEAYLHERNETRNLHRKLFSLLDTCFWGSHRGKLDNFQVHSEFKSS